MRDEYDLDNMKVKRRGPLPAFQEASQGTGQVRITITFEQDLIESFKHEFLRSLAERVRAESVSI